MEYKKKYLKYKLKYLQLKQKHNFIGGMMKEVTPSLLKDEEKKEEEVVWSNKNNLFSDDDNKEIKPKKLDRSPEKAPLGEEPTLPIEKSKAEAEEAEIHVVIAEREAAAALIQDQMQKELHKFWYSNEKIVLNRGKEKIVYSFKNFPDLERLFKEYFKIDDKDEQLCLAMAKKPPLRTNVYENLKLLEEEQKLGLQLPYYFNNDYVIEKKLSFDLYDFIIANKHKNNEKNNIYDF